MEKNSAFYLYHPDSIGWLHRRHAGGQEITKADIAHLLRADPANGDDPLWKEYALKALEGRLPKRRGRKPMTPEYRLRLSAAAIDVEERTAEIRAARRSGALRHCRGDVEPCVQAADKVGPQWWLPRGRSLLSQISALKNDRL